MKPKTNSSASSQGVVPVMFEADWKQAVAEVKDGNLDQALNDFKQLAERGVSIACTEVGNIYWYDEANGLDANSFEAARTWYKRAIAESGDPEAHFGLASLHFKRQAGQEDVNYAYQHFLQAAESGKMGAIYALGIMYEFGLGIDVNREQAEHHYRRAAEQGHLLARTRVAWFLREREPIRAFVLRIRTGFKMLIVSLIDPYDPRLVIR